MTAPVAAAASPVIEVRALRKHFPIRSGLFSTSDDVIRAVDGVGFTVERGETFGLVGESGCGKTTTSRLMLGLETPTSGDILFEGQSITTLDAEQRRTFRRGMQAVFQDPTSALSPRMRVWEIVGEPMIANEGANRKTVARGLRMPSSKSGCPRTRQCATRTSSAADSASALPLRGRSSRERGASSWMSRCRRSTCRYERRFSTC